MRLTLAFLASTLLPINILGHAAQSIEGSFGAASIYEKVSSSVVMIEADTSKGRTQGSGVVFANGMAPVGEGNSPSSFRAISSWIVTNAHVLTAATVVNVQGEQKRVSGRVEYVDEDIDLALIFVTDYAFPPAELGSGSEISIGERVYAIGSPLGLQNSISEGIASGKRRLAGVSLIQTTAAISRGNSGGGLFSASGKLIGVTTFKLTGAEAVNFAVDGAHVREAWDASTQADLLRATMSYVYSPKQLERLNSLDFARWLLKSKSPAGRPYYLEATLIDERPFDRSRSARLQAEERMKEYKRITDGFLLRPSR